MKRGGRKPPLPLLEKLLSSGIVLNSFAEASKWCAGLDDSEYRAVCKRCNLEPVWD